MASKSTEVDHEIPAGRPSGRAREIETDCNDRSPSQQTRGIRPLIARVGKDAISIRGLFLRLVFAREIDAN
jgi:hypothetical protein